MFSGVSNLKRRIWQAVACSLLRLQLFDFFMGQNGPLTYLSVAELQNNLTWKGAVEVALNLIQTGGWRCSKLTWTIWDLSRWILSISRNRISTASLGNLSQYLTIAMVKFLYLKRISLVVTCLVLCALQKSLDPSSLYHPIR